MTSLEAAVVELASALEARHIAYAIIGGLAVSMWGEARATVDVDVSVWVEPQELECAVEELCRQFRPASTDPVAFVRQTRVLPLLTSRGVRADIIFGALPAERER